MANIQYVDGQPGMNGQQQAYGSPQQPVQFIVSNPQPPTQSQQAVDHGYRTAGNKAAAAGLSITILVIGVLCIIFQIAASSLFYESYGSTAWTDGYVWTGVWVGAWFVISGAIGIVSTRMNSKPLLITFMVLNILSCVIFTWVLLGMAATSLGLINICSSGYYNYSGTYYGYSCNGAQKAAMGMNSLLIIAAVLLFILCLTASIIGCCTFCAPTGREIGGGVVTTGAPYYTSGSGAVQITQTTTHYPQMQQQQQQQQQQQSMTPAYQPVAQLPPYSQQASSTSAPDAPQTSPSPQYTEKAN